MKVEWTITDDFIKAFKDLMSKNKDSDVVRERKQKNIERKAEALLESNSFVVDYKKIRSKSEDEIRQELQKNGLRRNEKIASYLLSIIQALENGEWKNLEEKLNYLKDHDTPKTEKETVNYILQAKNGKEKIYEGLGLKQSRNFLLWLGLTQYEIPIDSRCLKVLASCGAGFVPTASALQDPVTYAFLEEGIQLASKKLGIKPCIFDAYCFVSPEE